MLCTCTICPWQKAKLEDLISRARVIKIDDDKDAGRSPPNRISHLNVAVTLSDARYLQGFGVKGGFEARSLQDLALKDCG